MKIPTSFCLLGRTIEVIYDNPRCEKQEVLGLSDSDFGRVFLCNEYKGEKLPQSVLEHVFLHESVHCMLDMMGEKKLGENEKFVDLIAGMIHQMINTSQGNEN